MPFPLERKYLREKLRLPIKHRFCVLDGIIYQNLTNLFHWHWLFLCLLPYVYMYIREIAFTFLFMHQTFV
jgi:hypothetical protein